MNHWLFSVSVVIVSSNVWQNSESLNQYLKKKVKGKNQKGTEEIEEQPKKKTTYIRKHNYTTHKIRR